MIFEDYLSIGYQLYSQIYHVSQYLKKEIIAKLWKLIIKKDEQIFQKLWELTEVRKLESEIDLIKLNIYL